MFNYESPITQILGEMQTEYENHVLKAVQNVGIHVNREELVKALAYDRGQYVKGYKDGYAEGIDKFAERIKFEIANCSWQFSRLETSTIDEIAAQLKEREA